MDTLLEEPRFVQVYNPRGWWVKVDRKKGTIVGHRRSEWPGVQVVDGVETEQREEVT